MQAKSSSSEPGIFQEVETLAESLLMEGYSLYPYRPSSLKNRFRGVFGALFPPHFCRTGDSGERFLAAAEWLVEFDRPPRIDLELRFLVLNQTGGHREEARATVDAGHESVSVLFQRGPISGELRGRIFRLERGLWKLRVEAENLSQVQSPDRETALCGAMASTQLLAATSSGAFVSVSDPPERLRARTEALAQDGWWPVLAGDSSQPRFMIASPVILEDFPRIAAASPGNFFDGTEIDEMLTLRILTMTEAEKREAAAADPHVRDLIQRVEQLTPGQVERLHGSSKSDCGFRPGEKVRIAPSMRADSFDFHLAGKLATVSTVENDGEGGWHVGVVLDDDPGRDLGWRGWPGHRFFFKPSELRREGP